MWSLCTAVREAPVTVSTTPSLTSTWGEHLASHGLGVSAIDFRLLLQARRPGPVDEVSHGIRWFERNACGPGLKVLSPVRCVCLLTSLARQRIDGLRSYAEPTLSAHGAGWWCAYRFEVDWPLSVLLSLSMLQGACHIDSR